MEEECYTDIECLSEVSFLITENLVENKQTIACTSIDLTIHPLSTFLYSATLALTFVSGIT